MNLHRLFKRSAVAMMKGSGFSDLLVRRMRKQGIRLGGSDRRMPGQCVDLGMVEESGSETLFRQSRKLLLDSVTDGEVRINNTPSFHFFEKRAWMVRDAKIIGLYGLGIADGRILLDMIYYEDLQIEQYILLHLHHAPTRLIPATSPFHRFPPVRAVRRADVAVMLYGRWCNYYHWFAEHFLKLRAVEQYERQGGKKPLLILQPEPAPFMLESLELAGFGDYERVCWDMTTLHADELIVSSFPELSEKALRWLRARLLKPEFEPSEGERRRRLYLSRRDAGWRRVVNEPELEPVLKRFGFEAVVMSGLSVREQIRLFRSAEIVVSPHGAGLTNLLWGDKAVVVELFGGEVRFHYAHIANLCGHRYRALLCRSAGEQEDIIADPKALERLLAEILDE